MPADIQLSGMEVSLVNAMSRETILRQYAKPSNDGLFCVKDFCNHGHIGSYTLITPQVLLYFAGLRVVIMMVV